MNILSFIINNLVKITCSTTYKKLCVNIDFVNIIRVFLLGVGGCFYFSGVRIVFFASLWVSGKSAI